MKFSWFVLFWAIILPLFFSCDPEEESVSDNQYVNNWILEKMETYYYWEDKIPSIKNDTLPPEDFFESLLYKYDASSAPDGDRFSWIQENYVELQNMLSGVSSNEIGFDYILLYLSSNSDLLIGQVTYVKKGTPAESAGVKRGWWFNSINGTALSISNYKNLLSLSTENITVGFVNEKYDENGNFTGFGKNSDVTFRTLSSYSENPVYLDSIYVFNQSKIGYLVYNFFAPDAGDGNLTYDKKLNSIFGKFKSAGITDLILDLRYNSGGYASSELNLASMIVPNLNTANLFTYYDYNSFLDSYYANKYGADYFKSFFKDKISFEMINNVGTNLTRLYILTGLYTASASEQIINGLKPYMNVVLIGSVTIGKNVSSITLFEEDDPKNKWGMQPIVAKVFNSLDQSDFTAGFTPDFAVDDVGEPGIKQLGDITETLLNVALINATGISSIRSATPKGDGIVQKNKIIVSPGHIQRGLVIDDAPTFE